MIEIYKASAGSGKTETLSRNYIKLLLNDTADENDAYRHILAVTFTNKATDEMKERVLSKLYQFSREDSETGRKAKSVLIHLLHDYSAFYISTIDRFFQLVTRSFAREIGQYASYRVELDENSILEQAIENMFNSLERDENKDLLKWLVNCAINQLEFKGTNNIEKELLDMASLFLKEDFRIKKLKALEAGRFYTDRNRIEELEKGIRKNVKDWESQVVELVKNALRIVSDAGLSPKDFTQAKKSGINCLEGYLKRDCKFEKQPNSHFYNLLKGPQTWFSKNAPEDIKAKGEKAFANGLLDTLKQIEGYFGAAFRNYHTNVLILRNLYIFGLFNEIYRNIYDVLKEQNTMLLSETTEAIHRIIDGSDVPFIYEKIGNRFDHFMLDEFQDTSVLQWDNFIPLLRNSLASDNYNMIVGDVKQSIYRWRGSDWNTLDTGINKDFREDQLKYPPLSDNYRSGKEIVRFNGDFFTSINLDEKISEIYKGARQTAKKQFDGHIKVNYLDGNSKEFKERSLVLLKEQLDRLTKELHYPQSSIAVLTRANSEAKIVAETLISYGYDVISEESLTLSSSSTVTGLLSILKALLYPEDTRNVLLLGQLGIDVGLLELDFESEEGSLYNLCEALLRKAFPSIPEGEIVYVNAFLDLVLDYQITNGSNTAGFLDWWKETGFKKTLTMPDMADAVKVFTIHKSKGLEMDVVILPFFNIKLARDNNSNVYLWCTPPEQLSQMGIVPLKFVSGMEKSLFDKEYEQELLYTQIDAVNTAYVAMTRPKTELIINAPLNTNRQAVSDLLLDYLKGQFGEQDSYEIGTELDYETYLSLSASNREDTESASGKLQVRITENGSFPIHGESGRLKMAYLAADFFEDSNRIKGIVLHDIMSAVYTPDDLPTAVSSAVREGKLSEEDSARVLQKLSSRINSHPEWYDGSMQVLNELTIVSTDGSAERPDRVLIDGDRAIVIDYKFGGEDSKYKFQVLRYMHSLKKMGYKNVKGYIWYLVDDIIENVE